MDSFVIPAPPPIVAVPTVGELRAAFQATQDAGAVYVAALQHAFGANWPCFAAAAHLPNPHPHRARLSELRATWEAQHAAYTRAWRLFHLPRAGES